MGLFDFLKKKSASAVNFKVYTPSAEEISESRKSLAKQETRNFQKDESGLYPHEILLLSYYEKYSARKPVARFWQYEFGVDDVPALMRDLEQRGFASGGKLTQLGERKVVNGEYISYIRRHKSYDISLSSLSILVNKYPEIPYRDLIWGEFNRKSLEYMKNRQFGSYRNTQYSMYQFLMEEKRYGDAFPHLAQVLFYDLNGNGSPFLPNNIIENIREISRILDETDEHIIAKLQSEYFGIVAPYKNFTIDEIACIFTAYAFGHDEMAKEILDGHNAKIM